MKYLSCEIDDKEGYLIPIGDLHIGDSAFQKGGLEKLNGYLRWVKDHPSARIFLLGDIFNCASRISKTDPFSTDTGEYEKAIDIFKPYASQIVGAIDGNHEARILDMFGMSPTQGFCRELNIPYCKWSALVRFKVGKRANIVGGWRGNYYVYFHHSTGGGGTIGGKINRAVKLRDIVEGVDVYCIGHNHQLACAPQDVYYPSQHGAQKRRIWYVDCGSYLAWEDSYAEKGMMMPTKLGSPKITFSGTVRDIHVSI
jgi:UDP-2,3-diacylglucosamine pyrophosphatase LpxH